MKNKSLIFIFALMLAFTPCVYSEGETDYTENQNAQEELAENTLPDNAVEEQTVQTAEQPDELKTEQTSYKQPLSKKKLIKKFLLAMLAVAGSSIALYAILTLYNNLRGFSNVTDTKGSESFDLKTPDNMNGAIKTFLDKTHWE